MTPAERNNIRLGAYEILREVKERLPEEGALSLDELLIDTARASEIHALTAAFVGVAHSSRECGFSAGDLYTPLVELDAERVRGVLAVAIAFILEA